MNEPLELEFRHLRRLQREADLGPLEWEQLAEAARRYFAAEVPPAELLADPEAPGVDAARSWQGFLERWDVYEGVTPRFAAYFYNGDSGCLFHHGTTDVAAELVQHRLQCPDARLRAALELAWGRARAEHRGELTCG